MLSIQSISKSYKKQQVLQNVSFDAAPGECIGLLGPNGCGKSTLLHILSGTDTPDSGTILFDGKDLLKNPSLQSTKIGYVAQNNPLFPDMTAMDHLKLWYSATEYSIEDDLKDGFLSILKIEPFLHKKAKALSGGMQKRLSIACALASRPTLLLLDEPDAALDLVCKEDIREYIRLYCAQGNTVLLATHEEADFDLCSKLILLKDGFLSILKIEPFLHKKAKALSGGMQKRLSIACALASRPTLLLLDEPDAALDLVCKEDIREYIRLYCAQGNTVLLATHEEADFDLCSKLILLKDGQARTLAADTPVKEIIEYLS